MERTQPFERIGHRGAPREARENTLPSVERAIERGADAVEIDVHATADAILVVHHDPTFAEGVSPASLRGRAIAELSWAAVRSAELAPGVGIPRLDELLDRVAGRAIVYVEVKGAGIEQLVADAVARSAATCAVHSFDHAAIERLRAIAPTIPRGILFESEPSALEDVIERTGARDVWPHWQLIDRPLVERVHAANGRVIAWTVNSSEVAAELARLGVDGICSDDLRFLSPGGS